jgi:hypothetical protein
MVTRAFTVAGACALAIILTSAGPMFAVAEADETGDPAALLSAFFGLDNNLPFLANMLCLGASGMDGMPVVLSRTIDPETLQAEDFRIVTASGDERAPHCVTFLSASSVTRTMTRLHPCKLLAIYCHKAHNRRMVSEPTFEDYTQQ